MEQITINNGLLSITILSYGATIQEFIHLPTQQNLVVGLSNKEDYYKDSRYLGACVGRFAGRISGGGFHLEGTHYPLFNVDGIHLHGGKCGFSHRLWTVSEINRGKVPAVTLSYCSPHMEEGYPGELKCSVTYRLREDKLEIIHEATSDQPTVINMVNHSYFRLDKEDTISHYRLQIAAEDRLETQENLIPTGNLIKVSDTPYDFRASKEIGELCMDTPFVFTGEQEVKATVFSPLSRIGIRVYTDQPAMVVYTPDEFPAICLETQNYPDAPTNPDFPSAILYPGERYKNHSTFEVFSNP